MTALKVLIGAAAFSALTITAAAAAPCAVGTTLSAKAPDKDKSSNVDGGSAANVSPGAKAESPGTVGAMNNSGSAAAASEKTGERKPPEGKPVKPGDDDC